ncbi:RAB26 isoform 2, partial [Pan troglodytes]
KEYGLPFMETSAKTGLNVDLAFTAIANNSPDKQASESPWPHTGRHGKAVFCTGRGAASGQTLPRCSAAPSWARPGEGGLGLAPRTVPNPRKAMSSAAHAQAAKGGRLPTPGTEGFTANHIVHLCVLGAACSPPTL